MKEIKKIEDIGGTILQAKKKPIKIRFVKVIEKCYVNTREGRIVAEPFKDVIIEGVEGEVYPCKIDIFRKTYEMEDDL